MQCRQCGTEIADKAIICYRCGAGTTDPVRRPVALKGRRRGWPGLLGAIAPLLLALYLFIAAGTSANARVLTTAAAILAVAGVLVLFVHLVRRR